MLAAPALAADTARDAGKGPGSPTAPPARGDVSKGFGLMQEGTRLMLNGVLGQMAPKMHDLMGALGKMMGDLSAYEAPQVLPNGDILIRRKVPLVPAPLGGKGTGTDL